MQDLVRGVEKVLGRNSAKPVEKAGASTTSSETAGWLERAWVFLEDGEFASAKEYAERVLDREPKNGEAYWVKALADLGVRREADLGERQGSLVGDGNYQKALRFGTAELKRRLEGFEADIQSRIAEIVQRRLERWVRAECRTQAKEWDEEIVEKMPTGEVDRVEVTELETYWEEEVRPGGWFKKEVRTRVQKTRPKLVVKEVPRMNEVKRTVRRKGPEVLEWSFIDGLGNQILPGKAYEAYGIPVVFLLPGSFVMGSPKDEADRGLDEVQHQVTLTRPFALAQTPCTQAQWELVMGGNPSTFKGSDRPVEQVSWNEAVQYCQKLTAKQRAEGILPDGWEWRLPTEAEWEYAARAGTTSPRYGKLDAIGWHGGNSGRETHPVKQRAANAWDLHDMIGNVLEWCSDWHGDYSTGSVTDPTGPSSGSLRVNRGGSWYDDARDARSANRGRYVPGFRNFLLGFRPALSSVR
jgi:formylglycine-generating enzyme required for sulfatase activity